MLRVLNKVSKLATKSSRIIKDEGILSFALAVSRKTYSKLGIQPKQYYMRDVLFIVGPNLPQVKRFRVDHQAEQLRANGMTADIINDEALTMDSIKYYRGFIFCRYPHTEKIEKFINHAKKFNKTIIFEIDDLVFDTNFTDQIKTVKEMSKSDRELYDSGVKRCQRTLKLCDYAITTTEPLASELKRYKNIKDVYINRNIASDAMVAVSNRAINSIIRDDKVVIIGYFSGSITHNEDFEMVLPALIRLMEKYEYLRLHIGGILGDQPELTRFADRVTTTGFIDWQELPAEIRKCDINLAPLAKKTIFNESKSEIKWLDAALVKTVTVASDFGSYHTELQNEVTGILVKHDDSWENKLEELILDPKMRQRISENAYQEAISKRTSLATGKKFADWLQHIFAKNTVFVIPSNAISGGVNVVLKHADILSENGYDVTIVNYVSKKDHLRDLKNLNEYNEIFAFNTHIEQIIDEMVATLWATVPYVRNTSYAKVKSYFVQNFETDFLMPGDKNRLVANSTYCYSDLKYTTMSLWCKEWLKNNYGQDALYVSNGLWNDRYPYRERNFSDDKIKILIEGDPESEWKNVDEAFKISNQLDRSRFEVNFLSYHAEPKEWYQVDNFYQKIPSEKVGDIYANNDILLKTSLLESFSYPPLEMMATGGFVVVIPNGGNIEYLKDRENCLMFKSGEYTKAILLIEEIVNDSNLRKVLARNGRSLAMNYDWNSIEDQVLNLYENK